MIKKILFIFFVIFLFICLMTLGNILISFVSRGYAYVGYSVWQPYEISDFKFDVLSGVSAGTLIGCLISIAYIFFNSRNRW